MGQDRRLKLKLEPSTHVVGDDDIVSAEDMESRGLFDGEPRVERVSLGLGDEATDEDGD